MKNSVIICLSAVGIALALPFNAMAQRALTPPQTTICQYHAAGIGLIPPGGQGKI